MAHNDDIILPNYISFGSSFGPMYRVQQLITTGGYRKTNSQWSQHLRKFDIGYGVRTPEDLYLVREIFDAIGGPGGSFLMRDWSDWNTTKGKMGGDDAAGDPTTKDDMPMRNTTDGTFVGDGTTATFQLIKRYQPSGATAFKDKDIVKPETGIKVALDGVLQILTTEYTYSQTTGIVTFVTPPTAAAVPTWGGNYYIPVAFLNDEFTQTVAGFEENEVSIMLQEVRGV